MPERSTSPKHCSCSAAPTSGPSPENTSTSPSSRRKPRNAPSPRRRTRPHHRDLRRDDLHHRFTRALLQLTTNLLQNAIVHNLPQHGTVWVHDRIQPRAWSSPSRTPARSSPTAGLHACRAISARHRRIRTDHAGVGLGLAIVKSITQAHDGTLNLTPRADGGLRVTVQLPAATTHIRQITISGDRGPTRVTCWPRRRLLVVHLDARCDHPPRTAGGTSTVRCRRPSPTASAARCYSPR
jgi:hypothetical protein